MQLSHPFFFFFTRNIWSMCQDFEKDTFAWSQYLKRCSTYNYYYIPALSFKHLVHSPVLKNDSLPRKWLWHDESSKFNTQRHGRCLLDKILHNFFLEDWCGRIRKKPLYFIYFLILLNNWLCSITMWYIRVRD